MKSLANTLLFVLLIHRCAAQLLTGSVTDRTSGEALPFAAILEVGTLNGVYSDIDGHFELLLSDSTHSIEVNLIGYESRRFDGMQSVPSVIALQPKANLMAEITIRPGVNPAERIIQTAIDNKDKNNPEGNYAFTYNSYNKLIFGASIDSSLLHETMQSGLDSNARSAINFFNTQHLFLMESITERKYLPPGKSEETIIANKVSGLKNTELFLLGTQLQSFSFYGESVELLGVKYLSPLANNAINKYYFELEDTTYLGRDTVFAISFRPRLNKNFPSMKGRLYINTNGYAIQNVLAEPIQEGKMQFKIQQQYAFLFNKQWFPVQLNSSILFETMSAAGFPLTGEGRSYIKNVQLDAELTPSDFTPVTLQMLPNAENAADTVWNAYREQALNQKELKTYHVIDSLGRAENLDRRLKALESISTGQINVGYVNIDLKQLIAFNNYEGFRLGGGVRSSYRLSEKFNVGGYLAYGFKDEAFKYGGDVLLQLYKKRNAWFKIEYKKDVMEMGGNGIRIAEPGNFLNQHIYRLFVSRMDKRELIQASVSARLIGNLTSTAFLNNQYIESYSNYAFTRQETEAVALTDSIYNVTETGVTLRFAPGEKLMHTGSREIRLSGQYPIFHFQYTAGLPGLGGGEYQYNRFDARVDKTFNILTAGKLSITATGGSCMEDVPLSLLYNTEGTYEKFTIVAPGSFQTMRVNEFMHSRYAALHIRHAFRSFNWLKGKLKPNLVLAHSMLWGDFKNASSHSIPSSQAEKGYFESGIQMDNLVVSGISGIGLGVYYRYGTYALPSAKENVAIKLSTSFSF